MVSQVSPNPKLSISCEIFSDELVIAETGSQVFILRHTKKQQPQPNFREEQDNKVFKALQESLMYPSALQHPSYQIPFFLFVHENEGHALWGVTPNMGTSIVS